MLTNLKIDIDVLHYNGSVPEVQTVTITEMELLKLAKEKVFYSYPAGGKPDNIFPTVTKIEFTKAAGSGSPAAKFTSEMEFVQYE